MKSTIATIFVLLLSSQVQADGFYQQIVGNTPQSHETYSVNTEFSYSPLYNKVISHDPRFVDEPGQLVKNFSYTPLYLQVTGEDKKVVSRIAKTTTKNSDGKI